MCILLTDSYGVRTMNDSQYESNVASCLEFGVQAAAAAATARRWIEPRSYSLIILLLSCMRSCVDTA